MLLTTDKLMSQIVAGVESGELSDASQSICKSVLTTAGMRPADSGRGKHTVSCLGESMETARGQNTDETAVLRRVVVTSPSGDRVTETKDTFDGALSEKRGGDGGTHQHRRRERPLAPVDQGV